MRAGPVQLLIVGTECISRRRTEIRRLAFLAAHILQLLAGAPSWPHQALCASGVCALRARMATLPEDRPGGTAACGTGCTGSAQHLI